MAKLPIQVDVILFYRDKDGIKYLLLKRTEERGGFWQPVTGGVEEGEDILYAARREVMEETGFLKVKKMYDVKYKFSFKNGDKEITEYVFAFEVDSMNVNFSKREHSEIVWVSYEDALKYLKWDTNKEALKKINDYLTRDIQ
ncbi:MAG TPA: NUDIX pyrophosphatase [Spirochaetota bacterium]|nr:NUDIX pyrophosphatase [Spirochaetota bacterium]HOL57301.1 NUDIX pyrophosphatase [Spirochaetota bacterium]HPP03223.1 NUDIX pyrophosphatase [Spirochaetota bacterium]